VRTSWRDAFLKTFMEYFKHLVHSMGPCYHNAEPSVAWDGDALGQRPHQFHMNKMENVEPYMFTLVHESAELDDWVTEKVYQALAVGSVPIYRGAKNIEAFLPCKNCIIDANRFASVQELGTYVSKMIKDASKGGSPAYERLLEWRKAPYSPETSGSLFEQVKKQSIDTSLCRIANLGMESADKCKWECGPRCWEEIYRFTDQGFHG